MIGIPIGMLTANAYEWLMHRFVLHGLGKRKEDFWSFHWHEHHKNARKNEFFDKDYDTLPVTLNAQGKEAAALLVGGLLHLPLLPIAPFFVGTVWASGIHYYLVHKRSHQDPEWAKRHVPWHYDHHMGPDQNSNWCVTRPWMDHIMGTRKPYTGTPREAADLVKRAAKKQRKQALGDKKKASPKISVTNELASAV